MTSRRVPADASPNPWTQRLERRRREGAQLHDLADQNPTRVGLSDLGDRELHALADPRAARYEPQPLGLWSAREAIAAYYAAREVVVDPDDLVLTAGTSEAYAHLFRMLCDPGDTVLVPAPSYPLFEPLARLEAVRVETFPLRFAERWRVDLEALERACTPGVRAIVLVQPNHPTGSCVSGAELEAVERQCARLDAALVADEVFGDFPWSERGPVHLPSLLGPRRARTFVLHGLSKLCGMPQLKLSWIALGGPEAERDRARRALEWIADAFLSVGTPVQLALPCLLDARHAFRERVLGRVSAHRRMLAGACAGTGAMPLDADGGWTAMIRLPEGASAEELALALLDDGVIVHPGHFYDDPDDAHLVLSLIATPEDFDAGVARIAGRLATL